MIKSEAEAVFSLCVKVDSNGRGGDNDCNSLLCLYLEHEGQRAVGTVYSNKSPIKCIQQQLSCQVNKHIFLCVVR